MAFNERGVSNAVGFSERAFKTFEYDDGASPSSEAYFSGEIKAWKSVLSKSKNQVFLIISGAVAIAFACLAWAPFSVTGTLELRTLPAHKTDRYQLLETAEKQVQNLLLENSKEIEKNPVRDFFPTNPNELMKALSFELIGRESIRAAIEKTEIVVRKDFGSQDEYLTEIAKQAYEFEILEPSSANDTRRSARKRWGLKYSAASERMVRSVMFTALEMANQTIKSTYADKLEEITQTLSAIKQQNLNEVELAISLTQQNYEGRTKRQKAMLKEQAQIARVLGIAKNTLETKSLNSENTIVAVSDSSGPLYYRGYEALEKELALLNNRDDSGDYIAELTSLEVRKVSIEQSPIIQLLEFGFAASPLNSENFETAVYSEFAIEVENSIWHYLVPMLIVFSGIIAAFCFVLYHRFT